MRYLRTRPFRVLVPLLVVAFTLFMLSGVPRYRDAKAGADLVLGDIFWFGFLLAALGLVGAAILAAAFALRHRSAA